MAHKLESTLNNVRTDQAMLDYLWGQGLLIRKVDEKTIVVCGNSDVVKGVISAISEQNAGEPVVESHKVNHNEPVTDTKTETRTASQPASTETQQTVGTGAVQNTGQPAQ